MKVKIKTLSDHVILPAKSTEHAAAYDVYISDDIIVDPGRQIIPLNFSVEIPIGYEIHVQPRSGFSCKGMAGYQIEGFGYDLESRFDCDVLDGKIDADYRGICGVIVNNRDIAFGLKAGDRIAQFTLRKVEDIDWIETDDLSETNRGEGGFGHTGTR